MAPKKIVALCDGTWCGRETNTKSNIQYLAELIGVDMKLRGEAQDVRPGLVARYADGVGLGKTFLEYLFNGCTANDIAKECIDVYEYIVSRYEPGDEIWMFGLSRGAFTVRSVVGMINNCGIVKQRDRAKDTRTLCEEVYRIYRSPYDSDKPWSEEMKEFRKKVSHTDATGEPVKTPVKFMGLFDTVGALGIPRFSGGVGFEWPEFYDNQVSSVAEKVYHAVSLHERLWLFQPCLASRNPRHDGNPNLKIHQKWFPGVHYDLGRQRFKFFRVNATWEEKILFAIPNLLSGTIEPNHVLADLVLDWMLAGIEKEDSHATGMVVQNVAAKRVAVRQRIQPGAQIGDGDVYDKALNYVPFGTVIGAATKISSWITRVIRSSLGLAAILEILTATKDRHIADDSADVYHYNMSDPALAPVTAPVGELAGLGLPRYKSTAYETFQLCLLAANKISQETYDERVPPTT